MRFYKIYLLIQVLIIIVCLSIEKIFTYENSFDTNITFIDFNFPVRSWLMYTDDLEIAVGYEYKDRWHRINFYEGS